MIKTLLLSVFLFGCNPAFSATIIQEALWIGDNNIPWYNKVLTTTGDGTADQTTSGDPYYGRAMMGTLPSGADGIIEYQVTTAFINADTDTAMCFSDTETPAVGGADGNFCAYAHYLHDRILGVEAGAVDGTFLIDYTTSTEIALEREGSTYYLVVNGTREHTFTTTGSGVMYVYYMPYGVGAEVTNVKFYHD